MKKSNNILKSRAITKKEKPEIKRRFLGKTDNFENNIERVFYQRMLKASLAGKSYFHFGFKQVSKFVRIPQLVRVAQQYY